MIYCELLVMTFSKKNLSILLLILLPHFSREALLHKSKHAKKNFQDSNARVRSKRSFAESRSPRYYTDINFETGTTDPDEELTECFEEPKLWCNVDTKYRSIDGRCNNLKWRTWGMANTSLYRMVSAKYSDEVCSLPRPEENMPSSRQLAKIILHSERNQNLGNISKFFFIFGEVVADDVTSHNLRPSDSNFCCSNKTESEQLGEIACSCMPTEVLQDNSKCDKRIRSRTTLQIQCPVYPVNQLSTESSFLDASFLYTSDSEISTQLRSMKRGKLKVIMDSQGRPLPFFLNRGVNRTVSKYVSAVHMHPGTVTITALFWRLHNFLADMMLWLNPSWEDEQLFQETRRILIAMYQHIVYHEFIPVLIGYEYAKKYDLMPTSKKLQELYKSDINPATLNSFSTAAFRIFHFILPSTLNLVTEARTVVQTINFTMINNIDIMDGDTLDQLIRGAIIESILPNQTFFSEKINMYISDIERGRDHGLPTYNDFRELCQLPRVSDFKNLKNLMALEDIVKLAELYADVDDIDLYVGGILENPAKDAIVGPTFQCLIAEAFYRYKYGDRFFYEHKNTPAQFTPEQVREIKKVTASLLICIASNEIRKVQSNVFYTPSDMNPETTCELIFRPDYSLWQEMPLTPKKYFNWK